VPVWRAVRDGVLSVAVRAEERDIALSTIAVNGGGNDGSVDFVADLCDIVLEHALG